MLMENDTQKTVALIGRPNVGKSTLFNRLIGRREAIETSIPGTTRDRLFGDVFWNGQRFNLVDVAGVDFGKKTEIEINIQEGINIALGCADLILFLVDWTDKENEIDKRIARQLRKINKKVILVINKADNIKMMSDIEEFKRLGSFDSVSVSALSGKNTGDLLDKICKDLKETKITTVEKAKYEDFIHLAIIGRPNVGKSTLLNTIVGEKRAVVSGEAGTTRDILSVSFLHKGNNIEIVDTAGIRRRGKIVKDTIESFARLRTEKALHSCDVAVLLIDAKEGLVANDAHILGEAKELGKGIILAVNKIDLWGENLEQKMAQCLFSYQQKLNFVPWMPVVFISAEKNDNLVFLLNQVVKVYLNRKTIINDESLKEILISAKEQNNQLINFYSLTQKRSSPIVFELTYTGKKIPHYSLVRYLENKIRDTYPLTGAPIFIDLKQKRSRS